MHDAYALIPVLERLPLAIDCIACWGEKSTTHDQDDLNPFQTTNDAVNKKNQVHLLVGTKLGHLLVYKVCNNPIEISLKQSYRSFSKKPIQQLYVSNELSLVISLSDALVSVHDLTTFQLISAIQRTKGATLFAVDLEEKVSLRGDIAYALKLCVAVKRKIQFYFWKNREFSELSGDVLIQEPPKAVYWCKDSVYLGFKREYSLIKLGENEPQELFPTGKSMEPVIGKLNSDELVLMKDEVSVFVNSDGDPTYKQSFTWSDNPITLTHQTPYLLAVLPRYLEVRTIEPKLLIQTVDLQKPKMMCSWRDWIFVSSTTHVWLVSQQPCSTQIEQLIKEREFELALKLAKMSKNEDSKKKEDQIRHIHTLLAFELFCQRRFEESLKNFANLDTDPAQVIGLFPDLLPSEYRKKLHYPSKLPTLKGEDLEKGLLFLIEFLTQKRNETIKQGAYIDSNFPIVVGNNVVTAQKQLLQIIDTTLLKCYLKTNDALIAPLLRLPDNQCHVEEAVRILTKANKLRELIVLYKKKGMHRKALDLLIKQSKIEKNSNAFEDIVEYLQHLVYDSIQTEYDNSRHIPTQCLLTIYQAQVKMQKGKDNLKIIFDVSRDLFNGRNKDPLEAMKIFTGDVAEVESLPKNKVLDFLKTISENLVVAYLEHLIYNWDDKTAEFHNKLALAYREKVLVLMDEYQDSLPEDEKSSMEKGPVELVETRNKLISFLEISTDYQPERILPDFPKDQLIEERAILLGRQGLYQQAIALYAHALQDPLRAEEYSRKVYDSDPTNNNDVFLCLLKMYLQPNSLENDLDSILADNKSNRSSNLHAALRILYEHSNKMDPIKALSLLPETVIVENIQTFLGNVLETQTKQKHEFQVLKSLLLAESQQVHEQRVFYENSKCVITDERVCRVCRKKIGVSAFARYPNDVVVHYYCCKDRRQLPSVT